MSIGAALAERGLLPDRWVRAGIRRLLRERLAEEALLHAGGNEAHWLRIVRAGPVALETQAANRQHYEVPAAFYQQVLGKQLKYSSAYWDAGIADLDAAEERMLALTAERARLADGQRILELGCGWGSLSLWMAERFPQARILAVSNSSSQREFILARAAERGLLNLEVRTVEASQLDLDERFDRIVSVEMFEHLRNWETMLRRARAWLLPEGRIFLHVFAHREFCYPFETAGRHDWMGRNFFTGGMMPSAALPDALDVPFETEERWIVDGEHYARTAEAWLRNLDGRRAAARAALAPGNANPDRDLRRWRIFFLACAELFAFRNGSEWVVAHHLLAPR
jgi:cyclopropane-fatty-acyl-phospholipid synthase